MKAPLSIYYLDDDLDDLYIFKEVADEIGHDVSIFINGNKMLQALTSAQQLPDIIFLDIRMPVFDGQEILQILKLNDDWKHIPVVMISGFNPKNLVRQYLDAGANFIMKKPTVMTDYRPALERVLSIDWPNFQAFA